MLLLRFALLNMRSFSEECLKQSLCIGKIEVKQEGIFKKEDSQRMLLSACLTLSHLPKITKEGLTVVPNKERIELENAIEIYSNMISVTTGVGVHISSPSPPIVLMPKQEDDKFFLSTARGFLSDTRNRSVLDVGRKMDRGLHLINAGPS